MNAKVDELTKETEEAIEHHEKHMEAVAKDNEMAIEKLKQTGEQAKTLYESRI
jgi:hypothetical protein